MSNPRSLRVLQPLDALWRCGTAAGLSDGQLLERFAARSDATGEAAFAALVDRHGAMVLAVCRSLLRDPNDAEDAFQATFLTLAQRARSIGMPELLGPWLHGVARRKASKLRQQITRRRDREARSAAQTGGSPSWNTPPEPERREQAEALHEEIGRLPGKYRRPIVLCYLEGLTHDEAAHQLGWPVGTVRGRLARARGQLAARLVRRGLAVSGTALVALAPPRPAGAAVPAALARATTRAALGLVAGQGTTKAVTAAVATLIGVSSRTWPLAGLKPVTALLIALGITTAGLGMLRDRAPAAAPAVDRANPSVPSGAAAPGAARDRAGLVGGEADAPAPARNPQRVLRVSRRLYRHLDPSGPGTAPGDPIATGRAVYEGYARQGNRVLTLRLAAPIGVAGTRGGVVPRPR
jgi:RNA polymerase sigma factor (sigma-70 family)